MIEVLGVDGFTHNVAANQITFISEIVGDQCTLVMGGGQTLDVDETRAVVLEKVRGSLTFFTDTPAS